MKITAYYLAAALLAGLPLFAFAGLDRNTDAVKEDHPSAAQTAPMPEIVEIPGAEAAQAAPEAKTPAAPRANEAAAPAAKQQSLTKKQYREAKRALKKQVIKAKHDVREKVCSKN